MFKFARVTALSVIFTTCLALNLERRFHNERRGGLLSGLSSLGIEGKIQIPSLSERVKTVAQGVSEIASTARETLHKLAPKISLGFHSQIGQNSQQTQVPNQNPNEPQAHPTEQVNDGEVDAYIDNHFPVILLRENEIRR